MGKPSGDRKERDSDTGEYSATKAPENREHVESTAVTNDSSLKPGGPAGAPVDIGVSALDRDTVSNGATSTGQTRYGEVNAQEKPSDPTPSAGRAHSDEG
jgi:hypothetical protein